MGTLRYVDSSSVILLSIYLGCWDMSHKLKDEVVAEALKAMYNKEFLRRFSEKVHAVVYDAFDMEDFVAAAMDEPWVGLELKAQMRRITGTLQTYLPIRYESFAYHSAKMLFFLSINQVPTIIAINKIPVITPHIKKPTAGPNCCVKPPANKLPIGVVPPRARA